MTTPLKVEKYVTKPTYVDAIRVTVDNLEDVALWCQGEVRTATRSWMKGGPHAYVSVPVVRPLNERRTMAFVGDWVLFERESWKVYTQVAFEKRFDSAPFNIDFEVTKHKKLSQAAMDRHADPNNLFLSPPESSQEMLEQDHAMLNLKAVTDV